MSLPRSLLAAALLLPSLALDSLAQDPASDDRPRSGPAPGSRLAPLEVASVSGATAGTEFDLAARWGGSPCAILFVHELTRETAPVIRELDRLQAEFGVLGLQSGIVLLAGDRTEGERRLVAVNRSLRLGRPIVLSLAGAEGPGDYALNRGCALTLVVAKDREVVGCASFVDTGDKDAARLRDAVISVTGPIPEDPAELRRRVEEALPSDPEALRRLAVEQALEIRRLQQRLDQARPGGAGMRGEAGRRPNARPAPERGAPESGSSETEAAGEAPVRRGAPPEDAELQALLRRFIRKDASDATVDEVREKIEARAGLSDALREQTRQMFLLMLSYPDRYGTEHAQAAARRFLDATAKTGGSGGGARRSDGG